MESALFFSSPFLNLRMCFYLMVQLYVAITSATKDGTKRIQQFVAMEVQMLCSSYSF
jgi:hypothetical protein